MAGYVNNIDKGHRDYLDYLKAIAAIFVVVGHCISYLENYVEIVPTWGRWISVLVSSVHVPLFFVIAGYLCKKQLYVKYIKNKVSRLLVPYITFSALKILFSVLVSAEYAHGASIGEILYDTFIVGGAYWFIYCMFLIYTLAPVVWKRSQTRTFIYNIKAICFIMFLIFIDVAMVDIHVFQLPQGAEFGGANVTTPFFQIERVLFYFPYFALGTLLRENESGFKIIIDKYEKFLCILSCIIAMSLSCIVVSGVLLKGFAVKMGIAISLMILLYCFAKRLSKEISWLKIIGKDSLHVMFFDSFYRVVLFNIVARITNPNTVLSLCIAIGTVVFSCISSELIRKIPYIRFFFGLGNFEK